MNCFKCSMYKKGVCQLSGFTVGTPSTDKKCCRSKNKII